MKLQEHEFIRIRDFIKDNYGINLEKKSVLIESRLSLPAQKAGFDSFTGYFDSVFKSREPEALAGLVSRLTTNYTFFMREPQHYEFMDRQALPEFKAASVKQLKIWSAGSSSGEEAYTAAIVAKKHFGLPPLSLSITATDLSVRVLELARAGIYSADSLKAMSEADIRQSFNPLPDGSFQIKPSLKGLVSFSRLNLMDDFSKYNSQFDIIFCRNVMIYFDHATRTGLVNRFYKALRPGGYFFTGLSETLSNIESPFKFVKPAIYKK